MKLFVPQVCLYMLLLSAVHLMLRDKEVLQEYILKINKSSSIPHDSSLNGVDSAGQVTSAQVKSSKGRLLVFVVHRANLTQDTRYWNRVIDEYESKNGSNQATMSFWGICDEGSDCDAFQKSARFSTIGYLDPYQMRIIAEADARRESLLYGDFGLLKAHVGSVADPQTQALLISQYSKMSKGNL